MKRSNKKGFTIVELVVVIAVIAVLAAVMIPTFSGVIGKANDAAFKSELKAAYTQYASEKAAKEEEPAHTVYIKYEGKYYKVMNGDTETAATAKKTNGTLTSLDHTEPVTHQCRIDYVNGTVIEKFVASACETADADTDCKCNGCGKVYEEYHVNVDSDPTKCDVCKAVLS